MDDVKRIKFRMKTYIKIVFIISMMINSSWAINQNDYMKIQKLLKKGDTVSYFDIGTIYRRNGEYKKAFEYFQKSANQGYYKAEFILGYIYDQGEGVEKDYKKAFEWYKKLINDYHSKGECNLATMYKEGKGVEKDYQKAIYWYESSIKIGKNPDAFYNLATMYLDGTGVKKDYKKAVEFFKKSINQKDKLQQEYIDNLCKIALEVCTSTNIEQKPSFDCNNVKKYSVESLICESNDLSKLDIELNKIYKKLLQVIPEKKELIEEQREFLKDREECYDELCIKNIYQDRLYILNSIYEFLNVNLDDYKSKKIQYLDIKDFTYLYEIKSKLLVNKLLNILNIFEKNNYILFEDGFLLKFYDVRISNGIYYANTKTGKIKRVTGGIIGDDWFIVKNFKPIKVVFKSGDGNHGLGYESIESITIKDNENIKNKVILETQYDMESGLCNRAEILKITKAGDIENFEYDETNNLLQINFTEQDCLTEEIINKELLYDLKKDIFINFKNK